MCIQEVPLCELNKWFVVHKVWKKSLWNVCGGFYDSSIVCSMVSQRIIYTLSLLHSWHLPKYRQRPLNGIWGQALLGSSSHHWWSEQLWIWTWVPSTYKQTHYVPSPPSWKSETLSMLFQCQGHERGELLSCALSPVRQMLGRDGCRADGSFLSWQDRLGTDS